MAILFEEFVSNPWFLFAGKFSLALVGILGLLALLSPRSFARIAEVGGTWVDTSSFFQRIDRPFYVDVPLLAYSRLLGIGLLVGAAVLVWLTPPHAFWAGAAWAVAAGIILLGMIATVSPTWFRRLSEVASTWIDTSWLSTALDYRVDIDRYVLRHSRVFGLLVLATIAVVAAW